MNLRISAAVQVLRISLKTFHQTSSPVSNALIWFLSALSTTAQIIFTRWTNNWSEHSLPRRQNKPHKQIKTGYATKYEQNQDIKSHMMKYTQQAAFSGGK